jgi:hypothetical protein
MDLTILLTIVGLIVALIIGGWQIYLAYIQVRQFKASQQSIVTPTAKVHIVDWEGPTVNRNLLVEVYSCLHEQHGMVEHFVILETWIALTFVADGLPNAIVRIEPIYHTDFERHWRLPVWYITAHKTYKSNERVPLPIELPPRVPKKIYFRAIHVIRSEPPNRGSWTAARIITEYERTLSPLSWTFTLLDQEQIVHTSELFFGAPEAVDDGRFKFSKKCKEIINDWPVPIPART